MRSSRLVSILLLLQSRQQLTARELADELEVSVRTVYRDIDALLAAGVPVWAEQGRAGGYRLVDGYRTRLTGLTGAEAESLFLVGLPGPAASVGLGAEAALAELKLLAALSPDQRERAVRLRQRFHLDVPAWYRDDADPPHLAGLADAVLTDRVVDVTYRRWETPREVDRVLHPYGLVLKSGTWYVVAGPEGGSPRTYRVSNVLALTVRDETFARPDGFELAEFWSRHLRDFDRRRLSGSATLRVSASLVARARDLSDPVLQQALYAAEPASEPGSPHVVVEIPVESDDVAVHQLLRYGPDVEVLGPPTLRAAMAERARSVAALYPT